MATEPRRQEMSGGRFNFFNTCNYYICLDISIIFLYTEPLDEYHVGKYNQDLPDKEITKLGMALGLTFSG